MCKNPQQLPDGTLIGCRYCKQCRGRRVLDWSGRCIAESKTSKAASVVTLTYGGGDTVRAAVLFYSDVQKLFKRLRKAGYPLKYLVVGEHGSEKGRSHWHVIIYWLDKPYPHIDWGGRPVGTFEPDDEPKPLLDRLWDGLGKFFRRPAFRGTSRKNPVRYFDPIWPHGHMVWDVPDLASIRYVCKYMLKDEAHKTGRKQFHMAMSKKPPLGQEYFFQLADRYVENGLAPQDLLYSFDEAKDHNGRKLKFMMGGYTAQTFLQRYVHRWWLKHGLRHMPYSEVVNDYLDSLVEGDVTGWDREALFAMKAKQAEVQPTQKELERAAFRKAHNDYYFGPAMWRFWTGDTDFDGEEEKQS